MTTPTQSKLLKLAIGALSIATLLPSASIIMSTEAGAYTRHGYYPPYLSYRSKIRWDNYGNVGSYVIKNVVSRDGCGLGWHVGGDGQCHIN
jgi:hypothetical protein